MALLELKDIGKIYVSEGNVAVGIRGVNLKFDKGEFVAVTGKSGSGKSTLLNVISGMDSYEEGEMYVEGQPTSHYMQPEWEQYRSEYISFIFQDYNIIESFTVLQNVELALMHIDDTRERRKRALELLDRVGLSDRINQKGSKLSGGQKQRTVIARALAKDSPIILADEPTGNLDSKTSGEIIELLREVSKDKLLIVVTHNFEQVENYATRHIRVFDGAIESDHSSMTGVFGAEYTDGTDSGGSSKESNQTGKKEKNPHIKMFKNGATLGRIIFTSKPKLSAFICILLIVGTLAIFALTSVCGSATELFEKHYMFNNLEGRVVVTTQTGEVIKEDEAKKLAAEYGATDYLCYDMLLDGSYETYMEIADSDGMFWAMPTYGKDYGTDIIGRYPEKPNEVFLYLPIYEQPKFGKKTLKANKVIYNELNLNVVGVKYFYDNTKPGEMLFTVEGFRIATAVFYLTKRAYRNMYAEGSLGEYGDNVFQSFNMEFYPSFDLEDGKIYLDDAEYRRAHQTYGDNMNVEVSFEVQYYSYDYIDSSQTSHMFKRTFTNGDLSERQPSDVNKYSYAGSVYISTSALCDIASEVLSDSYRQVSLFFKNNRAAHAAAEKLKAADYIAVPADTTYQPDPIEMILVTILNVTMLLVWLLGILFLAFVISLCTGKSMAAFKSDMAIMRSMGIPVKAVRVGIYVRMLISLIPAYMFLLIAALTVFTTPVLNGIFPFLHAWQYVAICVGMLLLTLRVTYKHIGKLFRESVKKSLKGGAAE